MSALPRHSSTTDMPQHLPQYALSAELSCNNDCNTSEVPLDTTDQAAICRQRADSRKGKQQLQYNNLVDSLESAQHENLVLRESLRAETSRTDFLRRMLVLLGSLTALLALSNIGASFTAARLAQSSTQVNVYGDWTDAQGHRLGTTDKQVVFEMYPIEEHHRRHLQQESFICNSGVNGTNCDLQGIIHYEDAAALYEQFCPTQTNGFCSGGGVKEVELMCNGHLVRKCFATVHFSNGPKIVDIVWRSFASRRSSHHARRFRLHGLPQSRCRLPR